VGFFSVYIQGRVSEIFHDYFCGNSENNGAVRKVERLFVNCEAATPKPDLNKCPFESLFKTEWYIRIVFTVADSVAMKPVMSIGVIELGVGWCLGVDRMRMYVLG
jgi:hypothetical protein